MEHDIFANHLPSALLFKAYDYTVYITYHSTNKKDWAPGHDGHYEQCPINYAGRIWCGIRGFAVWADL